MPISPKPPQPNSRGPQTPSWRCHSPLGEHGCAPCQQHGHALDPREHADDDVLRDGQQPPFHQRQPAGQPLRVLHLQVSGISGVLGQREGRVPVGAERADRVVLHPPAPPQHAHVELEDRPRVAAGDHDRHHRHRAEHDEGHPEEAQHEVMREHQDPFEQPQPARRRRVQRRVHPHRVRVRSSHRDHLLLLDNACILILRGCPSGCGRAICPVRSGKSPGFGPGTGAPRRRRRLQGSGMKSAESVTHLADIARGHPHPALDDLHRPSPLYLGQPGGKGSNGVPAPAQFSDRTGQRHRPRPRRSGPS